MTLNRASTAPQAQCWYCDVALRVVTARPVIRLALLD